jgi:hypothetical protein
MRTMEMSADSHLRIAAAVPDVIPRAVAIRRGRA